MSWIKCREQFPEEEKYILAYFKEEKYFEVLYITESIYGNGKVWSSDDGEFEYKLEVVDFWRELPESPKEDE